MNGAPTGVAYHQPLSKSGEVNNRSGNETGISRSGSNNNEGNNNVRSSGTIVRPLVPRLPYTRTLRHQLCASLRSWLQKLGVLERLECPSEPLTTPDSVPHSYWTSSGSNGRISSASRKSTTRGPRGGSTCDESSLAPLLDLEPALRDGSLLCALAEVLAKDLEDAFDHSTNSSSGWFASPNKSANHNNVSEGPMLTALRGWDLRPVRVKCQIVLIFPLSIFAYTLSFMATLCSRIL